MEGNPSWGKVSTRTKIFFASGRLAEWSDSPQSQSARSRLMDDSSDDSEDSIQPYRRKVETPQTKRQKHRRIIDDDEDNENDVIISSISCSSCAESSDENDEDDEESDTSSDDGGMKGFIVSDDDGEDDEDHEGNREESDSEEEVDDNEEESDDQEDSDDDEEEDEDPTDASFGHTYEEAMRKITRSRHFDVYKEKKGSQDTFCFRIRDSQPTRPFGDYQELLESLEKILGRDAVREDDDHNRHFIAGLQPYVEFKPNDRFGSSFFSCLCNQNENKTGGLERRLGFKDKKTGIVFLFGAECASKHIGCQQHELKHQYDNRPSCVDEGEDEDEEEDEDEDDEDEVRRKK